MSKSNVEEIVGLLWFILAVLTWDKSSVLSWVAVFMGVVGMIGAIYYSRKGTK
jgi:hypothetical protein